MIYLTKTDKEQTKFCINHRKIEKMEVGLSTHTNVFLDNGKIWTVQETMDEIIEKVKAYEVSVRNMAVSRSGGIG
jgi:uncharacterized protein YlzI (FlbEa/FlbD family)